MPSNLVSDMPESREVYMPPTEDTISKIFGKLDTMTTSMGHIEGDVRVIKEQMSHKAGTVEMMTFVEAKIKEHRDENTGITEIPARAAVITANNVKDRDSGTIRISLSGVPGVLKKTVIPIATALGGGGIIQLLHQWGFF